VLLLLLLLLLQLLLGDFLLMGQPKEWLNDELLNYYVLLLQVRAAWQGQQLQLLAWCVFWVHVAVYY
jgi:hypothetical protein